MRLEGLVLPEEYEEEAADEFPGKLLIESEEKR